MLKRIKKLFPTIFLMMLISTTYANLPYYPIQFPRDDAAHYSNTPYSISNLTEWWYYSGKLVTSEGRKFGYFIAIFNIHTTKPVTLPTNSVLMMQITDIDKKKVYGTEVRYLEKVVNFNDERLSIHLGNDFSLENMNGFYILKEKANIKDGSTIELSLTFIPTKSPLLINGTGLIDMWNNKNSYYYSNTRLTTTGQLQINGELFDINPQFSHSWMDHQWGDFLLNPNKAQWLWSCIMLDDGTDLSVMELIDSETKKIVSRFANIILPNDNRIYTSDFDFIPLKNLTDTYPETYQVTIPSINLQLTLDSLSPHQDSLGFWEGIHNATGLSQHEKATGFAYVENTIPMKNATLPYGKNFNL
jgi:predicted secreted hydrolase